MILGGQLEIQYRFRENHAKEFVLWSDILEVR